MFSLVKKLKFLFSRIDVELVVFLYMLAYMMNGLAGQNLGLEKACRVNLAFNASICDAMIQRNRSGYNPSEETMVQQYVTKWAAYGSILEGTFPVVWMMLLGSWSDRNNKRKVVILLPIFGDIIAIIGHFFCAYFLLQLPLQYSWLFGVTSNVFFGGGIRTVFVGIFSYVGGIAMDSDRTLRIGTVSMSYPLGMSLGLFLSGITLSFFGYLGVYSISGSIMLVSFLIAICRIQEKPPEKTEDEKKKGLLRDLFEIKHIINTIGVCFRKGGKKRRAKMVIIMLLCTMTTGPMYGEIVVIYLYTRLQCGWNEVDYSIYNSVHLCIQMFGNSLALVFFSKYLKMNDALLGVIGMLSKIVASFIYAFATGGLLFYLGAVADVFHGTGLISLRALMAKIVPPSELGQSNSVFGISEAIAPVAFGPLYSSIYIATLTVFPGAQYLFSIGFYFIALCLFLWLYRESTEMCEDEHKNNKEELKNNIPTETPM